MDTGTESPLKTDKPDLTDRERRILSALVHDYIQTAEPVSSGSLSKKGDIHHSAATIRHIMSSLEERGFLRQPHVSAGRVPTARGFRFYVDSVLEVRELSRSEQEHLRHAFADLTIELPDLLMAASRLLSSFSNQAAVVVSPAKTEEVYRHLEFVRMREDLILVVLVTSSGQVINKLISAPDDYSADELEKFSGYLNELLKDLTVSQVRRRIADELSEERARFDDFIKGALNLSARAFAEEPSREVFIEGQANLLDNPEFGDVATLKAVLNAFDEKSAILRLFNKSLDAEGIQILIDIDHVVAPLSGMSAVTSTFGQTKSALGALGVIGPTRMNYSEVVPLVDFTARLVTQSLDREA